MLCDQWKEAIKYPGGRTNVQRIFGLWKFRENTVEKLYKTRYITISCGLNRGPGGEIMQDQISLHSYYYIFVFLLLRS